MLARTLPAVAKNAVALPVGKGFLITPRGYIYIYMYYWLSFSGHPLRHSDIYVATWPLQ